MAWQRLVRGRFSSTLTIGEKDVLQALESKALSEKDNTAHDYTLRPVLFVVPEGAPEAAFEARKREAEAFRARFLNCDDGLALAHTLRDVAVREKIFKTSADVPAQLRAVLEGTEVGRLTPPEISKHGVEMFALCERAASQSESPQKRQARDAVFAERFDEKAKHYLEEVRRAAMVEYK
jgi:peptidyl-prolyl cis-trans isomerase SurA